MAMWWRCNGKVENNFSILLTGYTLATYIIIIIIFFINFPGMTETSDWTKQMMRVQLAIDNAQAQLTAQHLHLHIAQPRPFFCGLPSSSTTLFRHAGFSPRACSRRQVGQVRSIQSAGSDDKPFPGKFLKNPIFLAFALFLWPYGMCLIEQSSDGRAQKLHRAHCFMNSFHCCRILSVRFFVFCRLFDNLIRTTKHKTHALNADNNASVSQQLEEQWWRK